MAANGTNFSSVDDCQSAISEQPPVGGGNITHGRTERVTQHILECLADYIFTVSNPIITVVSVLANVLTLVVMSRKSVRYTSVAVYLSALATSDSLVLIMDTLYNWFKTVMKINLLGISDGFCKFHRFFFKVVYTYSAWIVTSLGVERFIVVWFPLRAKRICSYRNTVVNVASLPFPISAIYLYNLWAWFADDTEECAIVHQWYDFQSNIGPLLSSFAYSYFPTVILVSLNAAIIGKLFLARSRRRQMSVEASTNETKETRITVTIVVICIFYVVMTVPLSVFYTIVFRLGEYVKTNPRLYFVRSIINMISSCSYGTTFFLYVLTSGGFRKHLRDILCSKRCRRCFSSCCSLRSAELMGSTSVSTVFTSRSLESRGEELGISVILSNSGGGSALVLDSDKMSPKRLSRSREVSECTAF